jgi:hypothetical protein
MEPLLADAGQIWVADRVGGVDIPDDAVEID